MTLFVVTIDKKIIVLIFQLIVYLKKNRSFVEKFIESICNDLNFVIINRFRSIIIKLDVKNIKHDFAKIFNFFIEWIINRTKLYFVLQRFERDIIKYKISFFNFKSALSNQNNILLLLFESLTLKSKHYRLLLSDKIKRYFAFLSFITTSNSSLNLFFKTRTNVINIFILRINSILQFNIEQNIANNR